MLKFALGSNKIKLFIISIIEELKATHKPSRATLISESLVLLAVIAISMIFVCSFDFLLSYIFDIILSM